MKTRHAVAEASALLAASTLRLSNCSWSKPITPKLNLFHPNQDLRSGKSRTGMIRTLTSGGCRLGTTSRTAAADVPEVTTLHPKIKALDRSFLSLAYPGPQRNDRL